MCISESKNFQTSINYGKHFASISSRNISSQQSKHLKRSQFSWNSSYIHRHQAPNTLVAD